MNATLEFAAQGCQGLVARSGSAVFFAELFTVVPHGLDLWHIFRGFYIFCFYSDICPRSRIITLQTLIGSLLARL